MAVILSMFLNGKDIQSRNGFYYTYRRDTTFQKKKRVLQKQRERIRRGRDRMIYSLPIVLAFLLFILRVNYKNKYSWLFAFIFLSLSVTITMVLIYINKLSVYRSMLQNENKLFFYLNNISIGIFDLYNAIKGGITCILFAKFCFCRNHLFRRKTVGMKMMDAFLVFLPCMVFYYINCFNTRERLYRFAAGNVRNAELLYEGFDLYNKGIFLLSFVLPYLSLIRQLMETPIEYRKKQFKMLMTALGFLDLFLVVFFFAKPTGSVITNTNIFQLTIGWENWYIYYYTYFPLIVIVIFTIVFLILIRYDILSGYNIWFRRTVDRNIRLLPGDVKNITHSFKNLLFSILIMARKAKETHGTSESMDLLEEIAALADEGIEKLGMIGGAAGRVLQGKVVELNDIVSKMIAHNEMAGIRIVFGAQPEQPIYVHADETLLLSAISNIYRNAAEAIETAARKDGKIEIRILYDRELASIVIRDNGCGIAKELRCSIFLPFVSTKRTYRNWGIGLASAREIIEAHLGRICVKSVRGEYTEFQILLPVYNRRRDDQAGGKKREGGEIL